LTDALAAGYALIDVRDMNERQAEPLPAGSLHLPMTKLLTEAPQLDADGQYLLICATGKRSAAAADLLRSQGFRACRSLRGGLKGLKAPLETLLPLLLPSSSSAPRRPRSEKHAAERARQPPLLDRAREREAERAVSPGRKSSGRQSASGT
jgi:rhodanese-related sulfurtransferase